MLSTALVEKTSFKRDFGQTTFSFSYRYDTELASDVDISLTLSWDMHKPSSQSLSIKRFFLVFA